MSRLLTGLLIQTKHRKRASQKSKKSFSQKMSRENEFEIIPTTNTKRHKKTDESDPKKYFKKTKKKMSHENEFKIIPTTIEK